ncbi:MAG TPA: glucoamylase family protein, partial [Bacteroidales bacterium]|nr:glucoamylase family protein [Bacteroidales bacterium]
PLISDDQLLTLVQEKTFRYFYDFAHPSCGLARERNTSGDIVTMGGSGFGVMALIVGMERGFITRDQGLTRLNKILNFLETCDRYHGAWAHWLNGVTGKTNPFTTNDDGADLVETSYMIEGLITMRQYLNPSVPAEQSLMDQIDALTDAVEYDWFTRGQNVLYWHWSPDLGWIMNMQIRGYNETLITYIVAATSTTHPITAAVYNQGYAKNGGIRNGNSYYGYTLPLGEPYGGPLFFTHYSFLGLDPRTLQDQYANYWEQNVHQSLINWTYCFTNPKDFLGYSQVCWGLTASDNPWGYDAQSPTNDLGVITPTAAVSALPYTPVQSMNAIRFFYYTLGDHLWGDYGFYDAFDPSEGWWADSYLAIDEGPIVCMIENSRTQLLWNLFMSSPKVEAGLAKLGFTH